MSDDVTRALAALVDGYATLTNVADTCFKERYKSTAFKSAVHLASLLEDMKEALRTTNKLGGTRGELDKIVGACGKIAKRLLPYADDLAGLRDSSAAAAASSSAGGCAVFELKAQLLREATEELVDAMELVRRRPTAEALGAPALAAHAAVVLDFARAVDEATSELDSPTAATFARVSACIADYRERRRARSAPPAAAAAPADEVPASAPVPVMQVSARAVYDEYKRCVFGLLCAAPRRC